MKLIKYKILIICFFLSTNLIADELPNNIKSHFQNKLVIERTKLENCIKNEGLSEVDIINTSCEISDLLLKSLLILGDKKRNINIFDALGDDRFKNYKKTKSSKVTYPKYANLNGIQGRQILSFTIEANGSISNILPVRGICGNPDGPSSSARDCVIFEAASKKALKKMEYKPAKFNGKNIQTNNAKHAFTFLMEGIDARTKFSITNSGTVMAEPIKDVIINRIIRVQDLLSDQNLDLAESMSLNYVDTHLLFQFLLGKIYMAKGDNDKAIKYFRSFLYSTNASVYYIDKSFLVEAYAFLVEALFKKNDFNAIAGLEEDMSYNMRYETKTYNTVFSLTYFYIGASLLNTSNVDNGIYYLIKAKRGSSSLGLKKIINQNLKIIADQL